MAVSMTMDAPFGSGVVVPGAGFLMNDAMDTFDSAPPGAPSSNGSSVASGSTSSGKTIAGGRRPVSPMAPTILTEGGKVILVLGAGGSGQPDSLAGPLAQYHVITSIVHEGRPLAQAMSAPASGVAVQAVQVRGNTPVPQADLHGQGVAAVVK